MANSHRKLFIFATLVFMLFLLTACGGNSVVGKWYVVSENPSGAEYDNMEFKSDGTITCEGVDGSYDDSEEEIKCNIMGTDFTCTWDTVDGHKVLYSDYNQSYYAKSVDEAKEIREYLDGNAEEAEGDAEEAEGTDADDSGDSANVSCDEDEAAMEGGLFVKHGDEFSTLQPPVTNFDISFPGDNILVGEESAVVAELGKDDQLVFFSETAPAEDIAIFKVKKRGKTFPFYTDSSGEAVLWIDSDENNEYETISIEEIDGKSIKEYTKGMTKYCSVEYEGDYYLKECEGKEKVTVGYHEGTQYTNKKVKPDLSYFLCESATAQSVSLGKASYATISTSDLENGEYIISDTRFSAEPLLLSVKK